MIPAITACSFCQKRPPRISFIHSGLFIYNTALITNLITNLITDLIKLSREILSVSGSSDFQKTLPENFLPGSYRHR